MVGSWCFGICRSLILKISWHRHWPRCYTCRCCALPRHQAGIGWTPSRSFCSPVSDIGYRIADSGYRTSDIKIRYRISDIGHQISDIEYWSSCSPRPCSTRPKPSCSPQPGSPRPWSAGPCPPALTDASTVAHVPGKGFGQPLKIFIHLFGRINLWWYGFFEVDVINDERSDTCSTTVGNQGRTSFVVDPLWMHDSEADVVAINKISISRLLNFPSDVFSPFHQLRLLCSLVLTLNMDCNLVGKDQSFDIFFQRRHIG